MIRYVRGRRRCTLLEIRRVDGEVYRCTDHDRTLTFEGEQYRPIILGEMSAERREGGLRSGNQEASGTIDGETVTFAAMEGNKFLGAEVRQIVCEWPTPWVVTARHRKWIRKVVRTGSTWTATLEGRTLQLQQPKAGRFGGTFQPKCPYRLGDRLTCKKDISEWTLMAADHVGTSTASNYLALQETGAGWTPDEWEGFTVLTYGGGTGSGQERVIVGNTTDTLAIYDPWETLPVACDFKIGLGPSVLTVERQKFEVAFDPSEFTGIHPDDFSRDGTVAWTTGANAGSQQAIASFRVSDRRIVLLTPTPYVIEAGDRAIVRVGCDGLIGACKDKFANVLNFGGDPFSPSPQNLMEPPDEG